jgi:hypothetical protein
MVLSKDRFAEAFPGEGEYVELKRGVSASRAQEAAVAFSNTDGGVLVAGVAPDGRIVGVTQPGEKAKDLHQALRDARDTGRYEIRQLIVEDKTLLVLSVGRRREGFAQTSAGAVLVRRGASNVPLLGPDLSRFIARHAFESFETTATSADLAMADPGLVERLRDVYGWDVTREVADNLEEAGFAVRESGRRVLTVAGALLLLVEPATVAVGRTSTFAGTPATRRTRTSCGRCGARSTVRLSRPPQPSSMSSVSSAPSWARNVSRCRGCRRERFVRRSPMRWPTGPMSTRERPSGWRSARRV